MEEHHPEDLPHLSKTTEAVKQLHADVSSEALNVIMQDPSCCRILDLFTKYLDDLRFNSGQLASFWMSFVDIVEVLLALIRASREGDWLLHLAAVQSIIPWCFAYDRQNYARYLSIYHAQMTRLSETHPMVHQHMVDGGLSVQLSETTLLAEFLLIKQQKKLSTETLRQLVARKASASSLVLLAGTTSQQNTGALV